MCWNKVKNNKKKIFMLKKVWKDVLCYWIVDISKLVDLKVLILFLYLRYGIYILMDKR